jgi:DNA repair exonuclease SbcCD ATPase subunit
MKAGLFAAGAGVLALLTLQFCPNSAAAPAISVSAIAAIQQSQKAEEAQSAYAIACQNDAENPSLHEAYIQKMLSLGMPKAAAQAALTLTGLKPEGGLAWAVVGYNACQSNQLQAALSPTAKAALLLKTDACVLANLGQLLAWYDAQTPQPTLSAETQGALKQARADLAANDAFAKAYQRVKDALAAAAKTQQDAKKDVTAAQAQVDKAQQALNKINDQGQRLTNQIDNNKGRVNNLQAELRNEGTSQQRDQINARIQGEQRAIDNLSTLVQKLVAEQGKAKTDLQQKQKDLAQATAAAAPSLPVNLFHWELTGLGKAMSTSAPASAPADRDWRTIMNS